MITGDFLLVEFIVETTKPGKLEAKVQRRFTKLLKADAEYERRKQDSEVSSVALYKQTSSITRVKLK